ncbi:hypothetical protein F5X68DRAFT_213037 [Plectosphaerella plurivora]|uniref:Uncharacterized protein n=1 Tax=Plectosphaerella plurivora TaxID=936078 RepID=A0A9P9A850_9PEZI|nr:hypothetical protein F5X68DRAFT_213037 [Plectosphaerella plurivora]
MFPQQQGMGGWSGLCRLLASLLIPVGGAGGGTQGREMGCRLACPVQVPTTTDDNGDPLVIQGSETWRWYSQYLCTSSCSPPFIGRAYRTADGLYWADTPWSARPRRHGWFTNGVDSSLESRISNDFLLRQAERKMCGWRCQSAAQRAGRVESSRACTGHAPPGRGSGQVQDFRGLRYST